MIKNIHILLFIISFIFYNDSIFAQCHAKQIMNECKPNIPKPYKYDSFAISEFAFNNIEKNIEVVFTAFVGQKYKLLFCSSGFQEQVEINIYDKTNRVKKGRKKLYDNSEGIDNNFWWFQPTKSGNYYIDYNIPKSIDGKEKKGCVVILISRVGT
ncbi:MAG: hypothetical protein ABI315_06990 [Bacteroidia bacterium]